MKSLIAPLLLLTIPVLSACAKETGDPLFSVVTLKERSFRVYEGHPVYEGNDPNAYFLHRLLPGELEFNRASEGQVIHLNSVIVMPVLEKDKEALLTIEFRRSDFQDTFIRGLFFGEDPYVVAHHPLAYVGIETILTDERVILTLHPGVRLHLRNGTKARPTYKTFANDNTTGRITAVNGEVFVSNDPLLTEFRLREFYVALGIFIGPANSSARVQEQPDGNIVIDVPADALQVPERYSPRVLPGP